MTKDAGELLRKALELPENERADLACTLIDSLDEKIDENIEAAWREGILRRVEEVRAGKVTLVPWDDVRKKARAILDDSASRPPRTCRGSPARV